MVLITKLEKLCVVFFGIIITVLIVSSSWVASNPLTPTKEKAAPKHEQLNTANNPDGSEKLSFRVGDTVQGERLEFSNGSIYYDSFVINSPYSGVVTKGFIWPENYSLKLIDPTNPIIYKPDDWYQTRVTTEGNKCLQ